MWVLLVNPKPFSVPLSLIVVPWTLPELLLLDSSPNNTSRTVYCTAVLLEHKLHEDRYSVSYLLGYSQGLEQSLTRKKCSGTIC